MTEQEYEQAGNLAKMRMISMIMKGIMADDDSGIDEKIYKEAYRSILDMERKLLNTIKVEG